MRYLILALFLLGPFNAQAKVVKEDKMKKVLVKEITKIDKALYELEHDKGLSSPADDFWVRVLVDKKIFDLALFGASIRPEIEMHWTRK